VLKEDTSLDIIDGRHLVVEARLKPGSANYFMPNSCVMNEDKNIFLITGPNMSGKSTFLRQNALIIILAQIGCFVPAKSATIGLVDAIYSRVGASDDLFKGQSTFMVEMLELSTILHKATHRSFLILDEIGRGTSTYDGLSIAWSSLEYLHNIIKAKVLFATHYHELTQLEKHLKRLECYCIKVDEGNDNIIFLYEIIKGYVNKSYGIEVAKLAGIPKNLIHRAYEILSQLEKSNNTLESSKILELDFNRDIDTIKNKKYEEY
jgi:DNA mismatch repair protein MutS